MCHNTEFSDSFYLETVAGTSLQGAYGKTIPQFKGEFLLFGYNLFVLDSCNIFSIKGK
jgi:hypothetical protein